MPVLRRHTGFVISALALLLASSSPVRSDEILVPPPNSSRANNATQNIQEVIDAIRSKGYQREAGQLQKLLDEGSVYYRTTGPKKDIGEFVHGVGSEPDRLYFSFINVKDHEGGPTRFDETDGLRLAFTIQRALHEMVHKDQGNASIDDSNSKASRRGYILHEVEAYRVALKKFSQKWLIDESNDYLKNNDALSAQSEINALDRLMHSLTIIGGIVEDKKRIGKGDRECRWNAIKNVVRKLNANITAMRRNAVAKRDCSHQQRIEKSKFVYDIGMQTKMRRHRTEAENASRTANTLEKDMKFDKKRREGFKRQLRYSKDKSHREQLLNAIIKYEASLQNGEAKLARLQHEKTTNLSALKVLRTTLENTDKEYQKKHQAAIADDLNCRMKLGNNWVAKDKHEASKPPPKPRLLPEDYLPPDMAIDKSGKVKLLPTQNRRDIDIKTSIDALEGMFNYSTKLLSAKESEKIEDPRTPCYQPKLVVPKIPPLPSVVPMRKMVCHVDKGCVYEE